MGGFAPSMPQDAVRIATGREASIRCANEAAAKPPKTTAWMAPRRLMANMPMRAAGIMGTISCQPCSHRVVHDMGALTVHQHNISLLHALVSENSCQYLHFI